jgi:profilin
MSWQAYIDTSLVGSGHVDKAAIISAAGDGVWANSAGFDLKPEEMKVISSIVGGNEGARDKAYGDGLYIGGARYVMTKAEGRSLYARQGTNGVAVAKTTQAIVIGHHGEGQIAGNATSTVEGLADYLSGQGY